MRPLPRRTREDGQVTVLVIGFALVLAMAVVVVVDASAAYLRHQALDSLADGAALAAADSIQGEQVYTRGLGQPAVVDPERARALVDEYLSSTRASMNFPRLARSVATSGDRVVVRLVVPLDLPFPLPGVSNTALVGAESASIVTVSD